METQLVATADAAMRAGKIDEAVRLIDQAIKIAPGNADLWLRLAVLHRTRGDLSLALNSANAAIDHRPADPVSLLLKGSLHQSLGQAGRAAEVYQAALFHARDNTKLPRPIIDQLSHAQRFVAEHRDSVLSAMTTLESLQISEQRRARRFVENVLDRRPVYPQEPTHYRYPGLADIEYFDDHFADLKLRLKAAYPAIRQEYEALASVHRLRMEPYVQFQSGQPTGQWEQLNHSRDWLALHLCRYGEIDPALADACPQTIGALAGTDAPDIAGLAPNIMFSVLAPRTKIPPHHGVANFRSVLHLPLIVPEKCAFRVGGETREWIEGEPWVFDDTIEHEAWNDSDEPRIILIADLWRPELSTNDRQVIREFIGALDRSDALGAL